MKKTGSGESQVAKMWGKAPSKSQKQPAKAASHPNKKARVEPQKPQKVPRFALSRGSIPLSKALLEVKTEEKAAILMNHVTIEPNSLTDS